MKITGVKKAVTAFNNWQGCARVYLDTETGEVWTKTYFSVTDWTDYHKRSIVDVYMKDDFHGRDDTIKMKDLMELCEARLAKDVKSVERIKDKMHKGI